MTLQSFKSKAENDGVTRRERTLHNTIHDLQLNTKDTLSHFPVMINDISDYLTIYSATMNNKKYICSDVGKTFNVGDIVTFNNSKWLVLRAGVEDELYTQGYMERCDYCLKWQDSNGNIVEQDCMALTASQYNSGEYALKDVTIGYNQFMIYMPLNSNTIKIKSDDRFFIDNNNENPKPYRVTRVDTVSMSFYGVGCIALIVTEDQLENDDNIELKICNYKNVIPDTSDIKISYKGNPTINCGGTYKTFKANKPMVTFSINTTYPENIEWDQVSNNECKIKCKNIVSMIGQTIRLSCTDGTDTGELYVDIVSNV